MKTSPQAGKKRYAWAVIGLVVGLVFFLSLPAGTHSDEEEEKQAKDEVQEFVKDASLSNGQRIYETGFNDEGRRIRFKGGPHWLGMHGGGCASCHGQYGEGGTYPHMCFFKKSSAITFKALTSEEDEHEQSEKHAHVPYTIETIRRAIEEGIEPDGGKLNSCMPRWRLEDSDFRDLIAYLIFLDQWD